MSVASSPLSDQLLETRRTPRLLGITRTRAFLTHLGFSATIVAIAFAVVFFVWYPHPYFQAAGGWHALQVLIGVDVVLGPILTLIVFKPGKKWLRFDLAFIVLVQLVALIYGVGVLYAHRPYFSVFAVDRFVLVARDDVDAAEWAATAKRLGSKPFVGPLRIVAKTPTDNAAMQRLIVETVFDGKPDIERRPEFWWPFDQYAAEVSAKAKPLGSLRGRGSEITGLIESLPSRLGLPESRLGVLPLVARNRDFSLVIDTATSQPLEVLDLDPWAHQ